MVEECIRMWEKAREACKSVKQKCRYYTKIRKE